MNTTLLRMKLDQELDLLPEEQLPNLYRLIHYFRLGLLAEAPQQINGFSHDDTISAESNEFDPLDEAVEREKAAFLAQHPTLLAQYLGEEVAIYQGQVVDHDQDGVALSTRIYKRFPDEFVLISPVLPQPMEEWVIRSPRFEPLPG